MLDHGQTGRRFLVAPGRGWPTDWRAVQPYPVVAEGAEACRRSPVVRGHRCPGGLLVAADGQSVRPHPVEEERQGDPEGLNKKVRYV